VGCVSAGGEATGAVFGTQTPPRSSSQGKQRSAAPESWAHAGSGASAPRPRPRRQARAAKRVIRCPVATTYRPKIGPGAAPRQWAGSQM